MTRICFPELGVKLLESLKFRPRHNFVPQEIIAIQTSLIVYKISKTIKVLNTSFEMCCFQVSSLAIVRKTSLAANLTEGIKILRY